MSEIGSEFWDAPITEKRNELFPKQTQWYISGRSALQAIIAELGNARSVSLPSWSCDSIIKPFLDAGYNISFYPVYWQNGFVQEICVDSDVLFLMDYFGYTGPQYDLRGYEGIVIRDVTHSIFSTIYDDADYYFGSLRKWCGVWTGGFALAKNGHRLANDSTEESEYSILRESAMLEKNEYIIGKRKDKGYLKIFEKAEECLEAAGIEPAVDRDVAIAEHLDVDRIKLLRRENADTLMKAFSDWLIFPTLNENDTPMFVPVLIPNGKRDALRNHLINNEIYCPIHWPISEYHRFDVRTSNLYTNEISLVCDQRYTNNDMCHMIDVIKQFMED